MKIFKFFENSVDSNEETDLIYNNIYNIISNEIEMQDVKFTDGDVEISPKSIKSATNLVLKYLKDIGVDFDLLIKSNKYNI